MRRLRLSACTVTSIVLVLLTQLRLFRCRAIVASCVFVLSITTFLVFGVMLSRCDQTADSLPSVPIVRTESWGDRFVQRRGLSSRKSNSEVILLVLIHASGSAKGRKRRDIIRRTWVSDLVLDQIANSFGTEVEYKFVLGGKDMSRETHRRLSIETAFHKDIIVLDDVTDEHETLTQRTLNSFTYIVQRSFKFDYILKCDDDTFVDLRALVTYLFNRSDVPLHWGSFVGGYDVLRFGPYAEQSWCICDRYLPYAFGGGYVISRDLIELLAQNAPFLQQYNNEDVSVAAWLAPYNIERVHDLKFDTQANSHGCMRPFIVAHKITISLMKEYFISLQTEGIMCGERTKTSNIAFLSHSYDWEAYPIRECCSVKRTKQLGPHQLYV